MKDAAVYVRISADREGKAHGRARGPHCARCRRSRSRTVKPSLLVRLAGSIPTGTARSVRSFSQSISSSAKVPVEDP